jgi:cysteinyl-tRNA synthetase
MSMKYLGETFDIHGGGMDLKFPHHENEIAQSEGATGKLFAKYWLHGEFLKIESEKMSKSLGNDYTFRDLKERGFNPTAMRYLFFSVPYDKQLNFTFDNLTGAGSTIERLRDFRARLLEANLEEGSNDETGAQAKVALKKFEAAMDDNLNTSAALAALHDLVREINTALANGTIKTGDRERVLDTIGKIDTVFNIFGEIKEELLDAEIEALIEERVSARRDKNFARSDEIRDQLAAQGIILEDTKDGMRWKRRD